MLQQRTNCSSRFNSEDASLTAILDRADTGVFFVAEGGRLVFANASGQRMIEDEILLRVCGNVLRLSSREADHVLSDILRAMVSDGPKVGVRNLTILLSDEPCKRWAANVYPLVNGPRQRDQAIAAVFVRNLIVTNQSPLETLARAYGLTASEVRVADAVLRLSGNEAIAEALGISRVTVRTHLNRIYRKSGTKSHSDLIRLIVNVAR